MSVDPVLIGPCEDWTTAEEVADCCGADIDDIGPTVFEQVAHEASAALFEVSGRLFTGLCERSVRPCRDGCGCWGSRSSGLGPWGWSSWAPAAWGWVSECGDRCGCGFLSRVKLAGYVREVVEVKIDGVALAETDDDGYPNWRVDGNRWLVRMDTPMTRRRWPACQNLALEDTEDGTFSITYRHGIEPPDLGARAAAALACEMYQQCGGGNCRLPANTTKVTRQGVTVERQTLTGWLDPKKGTGIPAVDLFLASYWRKVGGRRPAVWSPDVQPHARPVG